MLIPGSMVKADQERGDIIVYADEWCPYNCQPNSPEPGYLIEILKEVFAPLGQDISYQIRPWKRALNSVEIGVGDIAVGAVEGNHGNNIIGTISLGRDETVLVTRKKNSLNYLKPDDLKQHSIGMIKDYTYDNNGILDRYLEYRIDNGQGIYVVHNDRPLDSLYKMLINGRIDAFPENKFVAQYKAKKMQLLHQVSFHETGVGDKIYVAFSPSVKGRGLLKTFEDGVQRLKQTGRLKEILDRYGISSL